MMVTRIPLSTLCNPLFKTLNFNEDRRGLEFGSSKRGIVIMRDRSKNRKPLQRGRNLSIEAIQTVQALKRANKVENSLQQAWHSKFKRLLKFDMIAVLRELLRQNECTLALKVFEDVRKEYWYKPQVFLYADMITVLASNGLLEHVELLYRYLKAETNVKTDIRDFNTLLTTFISNNMTDLAMDCFYLMKALDCEPDKSSFKILINGLESKGETSLSGVLRQEAQKYYGESLESSILEFLEEEIAVSC